MCCALPAHSAAGRAAGVQGTLEGTGVNLGCRDLLSSPDRRRFHPRPVSRQHQKDTENSSGHLPHLPLFLCLPLARVSPSPHTAVHSLTLPPPPPFRGFSDRQEIILAPSPGALPAERPQPFTASTEEGYGGRPGVPGPPSLRLTWASTTLRRKLRVTSSCTAAAAPCLAPAQRDPQLMLTSTPRRLPSGPRNSG